MRGSEEEIRTLTAQVADLQKTKESAEKELDRLHQRFDNAKVCGILGSLDGWDGLEGPPFGAGMLSSGTWYGATEPLPCEVFKVERSNVGAQ